MLTSPALNMRIVSPFFRMALAPMFGEKARILNKLLVFHASKAFNSHFRGEIISHSQDILGRHEFFSLARIHDRHGRRNTVVTALGSKSDISTRSLRKSAVI